MSQTNSSGSSKTNKRRHVDSSSSDEDVPSDITDAWPRFIVISSSDGNPLKLNPFAISKGIQSACGEVKNVTRLRNGSILVECVRRQQSVNLLGLQQFVNTQVVVSVHKTLNSSRGIVRDLARCLTDMSEEEIAAELKNQGVTQVKRFTRKTQDGNIVKTHTYLFTFSFPVIPKCIKAGYFNIGVDVYVPHPLRCFKCQKFGHGAKFCRGKEAVCCRCSGAHDSSECTHDLKCANCKGEHMASSKSCPTFEYESKILKIKHTKNITYSEAKLLVQSTAAPSSSVKTYSAAISSSTPPPRIVTSSISCQTDISWVKDKQVILDVSPQRNQSVSTSSSQTEPETEPDTVKLTAKEKKRLKKIRALQNVESSHVSSLEVHNTYEILEDMDISLIRVHATEASRLGLEK
ncbi:uncharacterized protein LOC124255870 [Haliotis rubra]|uniref:uncharacterized protein LOC124255870 n=1 Tax=Haliotis rubra TaxID=36100 RepID=UPI001EE54A6E|nr:uncharacterized protein LOC124255870 [Haliotis rubra]